MRTPSVGELVAEASRLGPVAAESFLRRAIHDAVERGAIDSDVATLLGHHAAAAEKLGRYAEAEASLRDAVERFTAAHGEHDARTAYARSSIGRVRWRAGDLRGALEVYEAILAQREGARGPWLLVVEELRRALGDAPGAARAMDEALAAARHDALADPMARSGSILHAAKSLVAHGRVGDAAALLEAALAGLDAITRGERISPSARLPSEVRAELVAALVEVGVAPRAPRGRAG